MFAPIKCAAIAHNGKIYEGRSHVEIGHQMIADDVCEKPFHLDVSKVL